MLSFGDFTFDPVRRELRKQGTVLKVDPQQIDLLACFLSSPGVLLSKHELLQRVWDGRAIADSALSVAIAKLRKVLGDSASTHEYIENRYGRGYRFLLPVVVVETPRLDEPVAPTLEPVAVPLVGRVEYLQQLTTALGRIMRGEGSLVALLGEPGIGKTRLAEALEASARQRGVRSAWGRFLAAEGTPPLWPLVQVLRELNTDGIADEALRLLSEQSEVAEPKAGQAAPSELTQGFLFDATSAIYRTIDEISSALFRLSREKPILVVLDDLQWADAASLRLLNYLVGDIARWPLLVVATARSNDLAVDSARNRELLRLLSQHKCERVELRRLRESDIAEYIAASFPDGTRDAHELARAVYVRSDGNPFYMVELLRPWFGLDLPVPSQLRLSGVALDLVRQRLSTLPNAARDVLSAASVIGHDFDLGLLSAMMERDGDELLEALDSSLANDTIVESARIPGAFAFGHELIREVLYADIAASERCRFHLRIGEALERRRAAGVEVSNAELAQHFLSALPQGDVGNAIAHARGAAMAATRMASHADARRLLQRALEALKFWVEPDPPTLTALLLELSMVERALAEGSYVEHLQKGVALAREHRLGPLLSVAGQMLSPAPGLLTRPDASSVLEAAIDVLPPDDKTRRAIVLSHLAWTPPNCLSASKVRSLLREAEQLANESGAPEARAALRDAKLYFSAGPSSLTTAEAIADEIERELKQNPATARSTRSVAASTFRLIVSMQRGDTAALERAIERQEAVLSKLNNVELSWHFQRTLVVLRMNRGELNGVANDLENLRQRAQRLRLQAWPALWARDYGELLLWTGDVTELAARLRPGLQLLPNESPQTLSRKLRTMIDLGLDEDAQSALVQVPVEWLADLPQDRDYLEAVSQLAIVSAAVGSTDHCRALYEQLRAYPHMYAAGISFHCDGSISHHLGVLARALGNETAAVAHFETAVDRNAQFGLKPRALQSQYELAVMLLDAPSVRDLRRGNQLLERTHDDALQLGLSPLVRKIVRRRTR
ncbi:MAG: AAA family ATPase [Polyangiales bacterium]